jgi:hypothetical protein
MLAKLDLLNSVDIKHSLKEGFLEGVVLESGLINTQQLNE